MDYNYLFDPTVRLQRFAQAGDAAVLIDESHQLSERVRSMLSVEFPRSSLIAALAPAQKLSPVLYSAVKALRRSFAYAIKAERDTDFAYTQTNSAARLPRDLRLAPPNAFNRRLPELLVLLAQMSTQQVPLDDALQTLLFTALRWRRAQNWLNTDNSAAFYLGANDSLQLLCLDPAKHISSILANYGPNLRFSGTLSPLPLYRRLQGIETTELVRSSASYSVDQLGLFIVPDIPTYYRARNASMDGLVELVNATCPEESCELQDISLQVWLPAHLFAGCTSSRPSRNRQQRRRGWRG
jgi:Rad3-related DNA helicase